MAEDPHGQPAPGGWLPPESAAASGPPAQHPPPPPYAQPQYQQPPYGYGSPWASTYYYTYAEPANSSATSGFILSITSIGILVVFFGLLAPLTIGLSIAGLVVSRNGIKKVERGETRKNGDLARWGFWLGVAGIVLSLLAIAGWVALLIASPEAFEDDGFDSDGGDPVRLLVRLSAALARVVSALPG